MRPRSSEQSQVGGRVVVRSRSRRGSEGFVLVLFVLSVVVLLLSAGLAIDLGAAYVANSRLSKAVDAGALAGARHIGLSEAEIQDLVVEVADANYTSATPASYAVNVIDVGADTRRVLITADSTSPAFFSAVIGKSDFDIGAVAEATRFPLDMSLVLDLSYSLERNAAFDDMQTAANGFVDYFDDTTDQFGLVTYSTWAEEQRSAQKHFKSSLHSIISGLSAISDTNIEEGLRLAKQQIDNAPDRENAVKVVVLFTDGRPTAFADNFRMPNGSGNPTWYDGVVATYISGSSYRGLFQTADGMKIRYFQNGLPVLTSNGSTQSSPAPQYLPGNLSVNGDNIRSIGAGQAEAWASEIRNAGYTIFAIGLGNPDAIYEGDAPDLDFLRRIANQDGIASATQPKGEMVFAPSTAELGGVFAKVADRILTRLTQ